MKLLLWNLEWVTSRSSRGKVIQGIIKSHNPDLVCITEGYNDFLPGEGYQIESDPDYGYKITKGRRKVILWSKYPWADIDYLGSSDLPGGRYVSGTLQLPEGEIEVIGVCIPWKDAHVRTGRKDRKPWEDHVAYLNGLEDLLRFKSKDIPRIIIGDYNQRIPRKRVPGDIFETLQKVFRDGYEIYTRGQIPGLENQLIDHIAGNELITVQNLKGISKLHEAIELSDHDGVTCKLVI